MAHYGGQKNNANNPGNWKRISTTQESSWFGAALVAHPEKTYELYQARKSIWKIPNARTGSSNDWVKLSDFDNKFPFMSYSVCYALEIAPSDGDVIYTSVVESSSWIIDFNQVKLVKTTTGGGLNPDDWVDITPDPYDGVYTYFITDIAVSDKNPDEIWVCYSGYIDDLKVKHYDGTTWHDYSEGLPNVPLNTIVYYKGSDDMLFVGTDIGVYYRDKSMTQWEPFSNNLPSVIVNCLEINETNSTLRAATYGRGLWETNLICALPGEEVLINDNTVWDMPMQVRNTLTVNTGAKLTITNEVSLSSFAKIIVKPGAKLILDGATLTNSCSEMWPGIQVWGNSAASQYPDADGNYQQGYLEIKNGAVIENAIIAVDLWNPGHWGTTGGMVYATNAVFRNNAKSVHALDYRNFNPLYPDIEWDYYGNFKDCTFEITTDYPGDVTFYKHVDLSHVKGIDFRACDFSLADNVAGVSEWNSGIAAYDAGFRVNPVCKTNIDPCPDYNRCSFTGFFSAINAINDGNSPVTFSVNMAVFNNNAFGVKTQKINNASVLFSNFNIGQKFGCGRGISIEEATGFAFEENNFTKYTGAPLADYFGIQINNTRSVNEVYKNYFNGVSYANYSEGQNWDKISRYLGLAYFCNENTNNYADFYVSYIWPSGIQSMQGDDNHVAGNTFSQNGATWHFYNGGEHLVGYYYNQNKSDEIPDDDKIYHVAKEPRNVNNTCHSHYGGGSERKLVLSTQQKLDAEQEYYDNLTSYNNVKTLYNNLVDGGNTDGELLDIQTAQPGEMWELRAQLLGDSPHLSLEVLKEAADKTDVFTDVALFDILAANPDELKKDTLISYLENKENPLPGYMIDILEQLAGGTTYKTILQQQMGKYRQNFTRAANDIIRSNLNDTVADYKGLREWLDNLGGITSDRQIITTYMHEGNFDDALTLANMLPQLYGLEGDELTEHNYYMEMINLYDTLYKQGRNTFQLDSTEKADLELIADNSNGVTGSQAKSILETVYGYNYTFCPEVDGSTGQKSRNISIDKLGMVYGIDIAVHPNPARQWAAFDYTLPESETVATIIITDIAGKIIETLTVNGPQGQKLWDTRHIEQGVYLYTLKAAGFSKSGKIVISK